MQADNSVFLAHLCLCIKQQGLVVQSIFSLISSLAAKTLIVLLSTISNSQVFLLKKNVSSFCKCKSYIFSAKNISVIAIFNDQSFNIPITNIVSLEQLGPGF